MIRTFATDGTGRSIRTAVFTVAAAAVIAAGGWTLSGGQADAPVHAGGVETFTGPLNTTWP
ncbi:hypothetical protein HEB29_003689 [Streptomyces fulvorobeus]|uniref:Uncharacterized protein n=1 Tax=Streptomyces fulvorobeus TaxID=284028 RepID=A0A7Y9HE89_9ACTN|nr:hypothetical protein [Streptomyces fulvorobeus]